MVSPSPFPHGRIAAATKYRDVSPSWSSCGLPMPESLGIEHTSDRGKYLLHWAEMITMSLGQMHNIARSVSNIVFLIFQRAYQISGFGSDLESLRFHLRKDVAMVFARRWNEQW
jgi:hypothetical protein